MAIFCLFLSLAGGSFAQDIFVTVSAKDKHAGRQEKWKHITGAVKIYIDP